LIINLLYYTLNQDLKQLYKKSYIIAEMNILE